MGAIPLTKHFYALPGDPMVILYEDPKGDYKVITEAKKSYADTAWTGQEIGILADYRKLTIPPGKDEFAATAEKLKGIFGNEAYSEALGTYIRALGQGFQPAQKTLDSGAAGGTQERPTVKITPNFWVYQDDPAHIMITLDGKPSEARFTKDADMMDHTTPDERKSLAVYRRALTNLERGVGDRNLAVTALLSAFPVISHTDADIIPDETMRKYNEVMARDDQDRKDRQEATHNQPASEAEKPVIARPDTTRQDIVVPGSSLLPFGQDMAHIQEFVHNLDYVYRHLLQEGTDYYRISQAGKPSLSRPGSELIAIWSGLRVIPREERNIEDREAAYFQYDFIADVFLGDIHITSGTGSCNSMEPKYAFRWAYERELPGNIRKEELETRTVHSGTQYKIPATKNEIFGLMNTIKKMAEKRAHVNAVMRATGADRIFTQDLEDGVVPGKGVVEQ